MQSKTGLKTLEKTIIIKTLKSKLVPLNSSFQWNLFLASYFALLINNNLGYLKNDNIEGSAILFDTLKQKLKRQTIQEKCMKRPRRINEEFYIWQSFIWDFVSEENIESHRSLHSIRLHILGL